MVREEVGLGGVEGLRACGGAQEERRGMPGERGAGVPGAKEEVGARAQGAGGSSGPAPGTDGTDKGQRQRRGSRSGGSG